MKVDNVTVLNQALEDPNPVGPDLMINVMIAILLGLFCGIGLAFLLEYLDTSIRSEKDIEALGIPVIGNIAEINTKQTKSEHTVVHKQAGLGGQTLGS
jgi:capsular polysaccharide biosynthesis protein